MIEAALDREMSLLRAMGGNAIRAYAGIPARWVRHIYERHGIFTILNHALARYVLVSGRPMVTGAELAESAACVAAWLPGSEGGGVADVLFGKADFTGRLPFAWPAAMPRSDGSWPVLFPRGFGLETGLAQR